MRPNEVLELGEDGDQWMVVGTIEVIEARLAVIDFLRATLLPGYDEIFACGVESALSAEAQVIAECRIFGDPTADRAFYESPIGPGVRGMLGPGAVGAYDQIGRNAVVLGARLPDHREYLLRVPNRPDGSE